MVPRGGGMSYTLGAVPARPASVTIDMRRMNRVVALDIANRHVTVETGISWEQLYAVLKPTGLMPRFFGTMSGSRATIGGALGSNATGHGTGDMGDDLLGIQVVLPTGEILETGARATHADLPVIRHYGPDLTGVFLHDAGAFGIKTQATLRLTKAATHYACAAFGYQEETALVAAICDAAAIGTATSITGFGTVHHRVFATQPKPSPAEAKAMAAAILESSGNKLTGFLRLIRMANPAALQALLSVPFSLMISCDGQSQAEANARLASCVRALKGGGSAD
jgi:FAD/FMN-containing dehydrogenase